MDDDFDFDPDHSNWDELKGRMPWIERSTNFIPYFLFGTLLLGVLSAVVVVVFAGGSTDATNFTIDTTDDQRLTQSGLEGDTVVVLDLMATWCKPCKEVADNSLKPLYETHEGDSRVLIVSVSVGDDTLDDLRDYMAERGYAWPHAVDPNNEILTTYSATNIPKVVVIDMDGKVVFEQQGTINSDELANIVDAALLGQADSVSLKSAHVLVLAVAAGALSFLAPCAFPLLPGFVTFYVTANEGREMEEDSSLLKEALPAGIAASSGIFIVYLILGLILAILPMKATALLTYILLPVGLVLLMMGTAWLVKYDYAWITAPILEPMRNLWWSIRLKLSKEQVPKEQTNDFSGLFSYGVGYGMSSIGCTLPLLIGLTLAAKIEFGSFIGSMTVFVIYALSAAMMMIGAIVLIAASKRMMIDWIRTNMDRIKQVSGGILIFVGIWVLMWFIEYEFAVKILPF